MVVSEDTLKGVAGQLLPLSSTGIHTQLMFDAVITGGNIIYSFGVALISFLEDLIGVLFLLPLIVWKVLAAPKLKGLLRAVRYAMEDMCSTLSPWQHRDDMATKESIHGRDELYNIIHQWHNVDIKRIWSLYLFTLSFVCSACFLAIIIHPLVMFRLSMDHEGNTYWSGPAKFSCQVPGSSVYSCYMNDSYTTQSLWVVNMFVLTGTAIACLIRLFYINMRVDFKQSFLRNNLPRCAELLNKNQLHAKGVMLMSEFLEFNSSYMDIFGYWVALKELEQSHGQKGGSTAVTEV